jgi:hypothetical protein
MFGGNHRRDGRRPSDGTVRRLLHPRRRHDRGGASSEKLSSRSRSFRELERDEPDLKRVQSQNKEGGSHFLQSSSTPSHFSRCSGSITQGRFIHGGL